MQEQLYDYALIGGDMRQVYLTEKLADSSYRICHYALSSSPGKEHCSPAASLQEACHSSSRIICPIPLSPDGIHLNQKGLTDELTLEQLLTQLHTGQLFFAGAIPIPFKEAMEKKGVKVYDLMEIPSLSYFNTLATAEGAICEAISLSPINLHKSRCLILGYGKCGSTLAYYLKGMSCRLDILTRDSLEQSKAALTDAHVDGLEALDSRVMDYDFIFNTIPAPVLTAPLLKKMKPQVTIIDIASSPGGVDFTAARKLNLSAVLASGLPGKYAPASSARAIKETIETMLKE
ncbi:MAG: dipicolinate synthase subunit DpsA [Lachnospiraceae bacterium]